MRGSDIQEYFEKHPILKRHFLGIYAADELRKVRRRLRNRTLAIINTDVSSGTGKHWWCLAKLENRLGKKNPFCFEVNTAELQFQRRLTALV